MNKKKIANFLGIIKRSGNLIYGFDDVLNNFFKNRVILVIVAKDTSKNTIQKLEKNISDIKTFDLTKEEIEKAIGKHTGILGILDEGLAKKISEMISEETPLENIYKN